MMCPDGDVQLQRHCSRWSSSWLKGRFNGQSWWWCWCIERSRSTDCCRSVAVGPTSLILEHDIRSCCTAAMYICSANNTLLIKAIIMCFHIKRCYLLWHRWCSSCGQLDDTATATAAAATPLSATTTAAQPMSPHSWLNQKMHKLLSVRLAMSSQNWHTLSRVRLHTFASFAAADTSDGGSTAPTCASSVCQTFCLCKFQF